MPTSPGSEFLPIDIVQDRGEVSHLKISGIALDLDAVYFCDRRPPLLAKADEISFAVHDRAAAHPVDCIDILCRCY